MKSNVYFILYFFLFSNMYSKATGTIKNKLTNEPIEGVNILIGSDGTVSDKEGRYIINGSIEEKIEFSHIGFDNLLLNKEEFFSNKDIFLVPIVIESKEVIVTAELSKKGLHKTAKSITIFEKDRIRESADIHLQTYLDEVPNLNWAGGSSRPRYFQIRGVGERSHFFGEGPPNFSVGFIVDDMDLSGLGMLGNLFDLKQVEIFKGPQSTIFGSNALGGLISIKSNDPINELGLETSINLGTDNLKSISSMVNFKLMRNIDFRISSSYNYADGFRTNKSLKLSNSNKREESFIRLKTKFSPSSSISFLSTIIYADLSNGYDVWSPDNNQNFNTFSDSTGEDSQITKGFSVRSELTLIDSFIITALSSFTETDLTHAYDGDWGDSLYWSLNHDWRESIEGYAYSFFDKNKKNRTNMSNEIRFKYRNVTSGIYYKKLEENDNALGYLFGGVATNANSRYEHEVYAVYGELDFQIIDGFLLSSNFRLENSEYVYRGESQGVDSYYEAIELPDVSFESDNILNGYKFALQYEVSNDFNFFGSFSKGFKAGGINQQPMLASVNRPFAPEYLYNYEVGLKYRTKNSKTSVTVFLGQRRNQQVSISSQQEEGNPNSFLFYTDNATSGKNNGFEFENTFEIFKNFKLMTGFGYLNTYIDRFNYQISVGDSKAMGGGRSAAMSPNTASIGFEYKMKNDISLNLRTNFKGKYYFSDSHNEESEAYSISNFSIGKKIRNFRLTLWGNNILDKRYATRGFYFGLIPPDYPNQLFKSYGDPRQIGIKMDYSIK